MDSQGTWEILLLPVGETAGTGMASTNNQAPGLSASLRADGSVLDGHEPGRHPRSRWANQ